MKMFIVTLMALSMSAFAKPNECTEPGQVINREFLEMKGEVAKTTFFREGADSIPTQGKISGEVKTKTFKVFKEIFCKATEEHYAEEVCQEVALNIALGRGNDTFKSFFDFSLTLLKRAELFSKTVTFLASQTPAERLDFSKQLISLMGKYAAVTGIPHSWESFSNLLTKGVTEGQIPQSVVDEVLTLNAEKNKSSLGFSPMSNVLFTEGKGNEKLPKLFNLQVSVQVRADLIQATLEGVDETVASKLSISFIQFAAANGIPENWAQFVVMMKASKDAGALSEDELQSIVVAYEDLNRTNLGFALSAKTCKTETRTRMVNLLSERKAEEFFQEVVKAYTVNLVNGPLLKGEREDYAVFFDGLNKLVFNFTTTYNTYTMTSYSDEKDVVAFTVTGKRNQITPKNTVTALVVRDGKFLNLRLQNKNYNSLVGGRVQVKVDFFESIPMWPDFKLGSRVFELTDGSLTDIASKVPTRNLNRKVRIDVSVQIVGSPYYNNEFSEVIEVKN